MIWDRLGVGATPHDTTANANGTTPSLARETARLHGRLAGKKRNRDEADGEGDAVASKATTNGLKRLHLQDSSDEEESRTATIVGKEKKKAGKSGDKFSMPVRNKQPNGSAANAARDSPVKDGASGTGRVNPFSSKPLEDTRFVAPAPPKPQSISTSMPTPSKLSSPQSPSRLLSPSISRSSSNSRHSSGSRRMMLKQAAAAGYRIVSIEPVSPVTPTPLKPELSSIAEPTSPAKPEANHTPILQLDPIKPSEEGAGPVENGEEKKKKKRRRKKKKKNSTIPQDGEDEVAVEDEESD